MRSCAACWSTMTSPSSRLRHDIGVVHLRARRPERMVERILGEFRSAQRQRRDRPRACRRRKRPAPLRQSRPPRSAARETPDRPAAPANAASRTSRCGCARNRARSPASETPRSRAAAGRRSARAVPRQRLLERAHDQRRAPSPASRKRTSVLAGCTLTSTSRGGNRDEQREQRMAVARQVVGIGGAHRAEQQACRAPAGR